MIFTSTTCGARLRFLVITVAVTAGSLAILSAQRDKNVKGSKDHPMISRIEGSIISTFNQKEFDEYRLVKGPVSGYAPDGQGRKPQEALDENNSLRLEGRVWQFTYDIPVNRSTLEIARNYEAALSKAGFTFLYQCSGTECAGSLPKVPRPGRRTVYDEPEHASALSQLLLSRVGWVASRVYKDQRYMAARLERPEGDIYVSLLAITINRPMVRLDVIEVKPMQANLVTVNAATMATEIAARGSVALYGIYFDTDKSDVKPESRPTLTEIAALLKQDVALELIVVGHTDNKGTIEYNLDLSHRRSKAVVAALVTDFGIASKRLDARGVGFLAPIASNSSEEGRAKNRRVQLMPR